jgi:hypothetical protein
MGDSCETIQLLTTLIRRMEQIGTKPVIDPLYCQQAEELLGAFAETVHEMRRLREEQFRAVITGDADSERSDDLIHMANERKRDAKYAYLDHQDTHNCSGIVLEDLKRSG